MKMEVLNGRRNIIGNKKLGTASKLTVRQSHDIEIASSLNTSTMTDSEKIKFDLSGQANHGS